MQTKSSRVKLDNEERVYAYAMNLLNYRDYSGKDMLLRLLSKGADEKDAHKAIARLKANSFIDERHYANQVLRAWLSKKIYGRLHLSVELRRKNVSDEMIPETLEKFTDELEMDNAMRAARQFIQRNDKRIKNNDEKIIAAAVRFMTNHGFTGRYIQVLLEQIRLENDM